MSTDTAMWLLLTAGTAWHLLLIAYVYRWSPTLSVALNDDYRYQ